MTPKKQATRERVAEILTAALKLSEKEGYRSVTREGLAAAAGVAPGLITLYLGTRENWQRAIMREAIRVQCLPVIAQGLVIRDPHARKVAPELQQKALQSAMA